MKLATAYFADARALDDAAQNQDKAQAQAALEQARRLVQDLPHRPQGQVTPQIAGRPMADGDQPIAVGLVFPQAVSRPALTRRVA